MSDDADFSEAPDPPDATNWEIYHLLKQMDDKVEMIYRMVSGLEAKIDDGKS